MNVLLAAGLIAAQAPEPAPTPEPARAIESWTCKVKEQLDHHVSGMLQMLVYPDGSRRQLSYYVNWADQPGYIAEQRMSWIWIPLDATRLWKPDDIGFSVDSERTDEQGSVVFTSPGSGRMDQSARGMVKSLRPTFPATWVSVDDAYLIAQLWAGWPWEARLSDRKGAVLGSQAILLPGAEPSQAMFTRLRAELDRVAQDPAGKCNANLEPSEWDRIQEVI